MIEQIDLKDEHPAIQGAFELSNNKIAHTPSTADEFLAPVIRLGFVKGFLAKCLKIKEIDPIQWLKIEQRHQEIEALLKREAPPK